MKKIKFIILYAMFVFTFVFSFSGCGKQDRENVYTNSNDGNSDFQTSDGNSTGESEKGKEQKPESMTETVNDAYVYVQICGAVQNPGVYKVKAGLRIFEAVEMAGGVTDMADTNVINMAGTVSDEMKIYIPAKDEVLNESYKETSSKVHEDDELVNINEASVKELMTLPGIGEVKAEQIVEYRETNGRFNDISELMNINGIKQAAFDKIKNLIKV